MSIVLTMPEFHESDLTKAPRVPDEGRNALRRADLPRLVALTESRGGDHEGRYSNPSSSNFATILRMRGRSLSRNDFSCARVLSVYCITSLGGAQLTLGAVNAAGQLVTRSVRKDATIYFGMLVDRSLEDTIKLTLIATGLETEGAKASWGKRVRAWVPFVKPADADVFQGI